MIGTQKEGGYKTLNDTTSRRRAYQKAYYKKMRDNAKIKPDSGGIPIHNADGNIYPIKRGKALTNEQMYKNGNNWNISREVDDQDRRQNRKNVIRKSK